MESRDSNAAAAPSAFINRRGEDAPQSSEAGPSHALTAALTHYIAHRLRRLSDTRSSGATAADSSASRDGEKEEAELISAVEAVEMQLLRCLIHVRLDAQEVPSQPELPSDVGLAAGSGDEDEQKKGDEGEQKKEEGARLQRSVHARKGGVDQSRASRSPSTAAATTHPINTTTDVVAAAATAAAEAASPPPRPPQPRGASRRSSSSSHRQPSGSKARELYYAYTHQNLPPPPPPPPSSSSSKQRQPSTTAAASPREEEQRQQQSQRTSTATPAPAPAAGATRAPRSPRHHHRHGGEEEEQHQDGPDGQQQHRRRRRRSSSGDHANATHSQEPTNTAAAGGEREDVAQLHQQRTELPPLLKPATTVAHADSSHNSAGGTVRPLTHAELAAALGSWPSRIAQYTLTKQIGKLTVDAVPASSKSKAGELSSLMEEPSSPLSPPSSQPQPCQQQPTHASGEADEEGENVGTAVELHALLRRLRDVLQHTTLPVTTGGEDKQKADVDIIFPTFARFYLAHPSSNALAGRGDVVQRFLAELTDALVMAAVVPDDADEREEVEEDEESHDTENDAAAAAVENGGEAQQQRRTALLPDVVMTGDMVKDVELLLRHTPTVLVSSASFAAVDPSAPPAGTATLAAGAPVFPSAPALIRRVLRRLLRLSPSWHNTTMCTTPLVVGVLRRYSTNTSATNGRLQVRLLPAAEALLVPGMTKDTTSGASPPGRAQGDANTHFFYNALVIEVAGSDAAVGADDDDDAVPLAEEEDVKTRYSADVPESYRRPRAAASPLRESATAAAAGEHTETREDASHTPLSRQQCRLWQQLLAMAQFVHVAGTPAQVAATARYVALAIRHRREARQQVQQQQQRQPHITDAAFPVTAPASGSPSIAVAAHAASVPAFFFTLTQTPALTHALDVAMAAATRTLHFDADVREDQHEQQQQQQRRVDAAAEREEASTRNVRDGMRAAAAVAVVQPVSSTPAQPPSQRQGIFSSGPGLGLRALLGWRSNPPPPPSPPTSVATKTLEPTAAAAAAPSKAHEAPRRKPLPRTPSPPPPPSPTAVAVAAADDVVMRWMHDVLIPIFYETTVTCSTAEEADGVEGGTTAAASVGGDKHGSSGNSSSGGGRRHRYRLRRQRALLGRVQVVTAAMVHQHLSSDNMNSSARGAVAGARVISSEGAAPPLAESDLLSYLLLRQLFFDTTTAAAASTTAASATAPTRRAHSAPLPQQAALATDESAGAAGRSSRPSENGVGPDQLRQQRRALSAAPHSPTRRVQQERRRVSFQNDTAAGTTPPRQRVAQGAAADNDDVDTGGMSADATQRRSASPFPSPKSILKSGHRYKAEKLVRSSAPAVSVVPFRSFTLWRWLAAEVWITSCRMAARHSTTTAAAAEDLSPALHLTSACYLAEAQAAAVRVASDVVTSLLLSMLQAEQYACYCQLQQRPRTHQTQQQGDVDNGNTMRERRRYTTNNAFRCEDILPLASGVAEAVVRAALAPVVCVAGVPEALQVIVGGKEKKKEEEQSASGAAADCNNNNDAARGETEGSSDESDSDAAASISEEKEGTFLAAADITRSGRHGASSGPIISAFSPALPHDVFQRLHIVSAVCTSRVQHEVLESLARPLQLALRRLARCFARHRQHLLCAPLVDFWKAHADAVALAEAAVATSSSVATIKHYTLAEREAVLRRWAAVEDGLCTRVRRVVELYDDCLVLPRLRSRVGASRAVQLSPGDSEEDDDDDDGAATTLSAPESSSLGADVESSPLPAWTTAQQSRQQQQELQGGDAFVPLCFSDATRYQKTSMSTFVNAPEASASPRGQQQQQRQRRLSYPQTPWLNALAVWNPAEVESDTSFDLHSSYGCDWRSLRLSGGASSLAAAASDFAVAVAAATPLQLRPPPALHLTPQTQQQQQHQPQQLHVSVPQQHNYHVPSAFSLSPAISATAASATGNTATTTTSSTVGILLSSSRLVVPNALQSTERYRENDPTKNGSPTQPLIASTFAHRTSGATLLSPLWQRLLTPRDGPRLDSVADATSPASFLAITSASVRQQSSPRVPVVTVVGGGASLPASFKHDAQTSAAASVTPLTQESGEREAQPLVAHLRVGDVVESRLLSPYVEDAKRVLIGAFLCQWVLPRWQLLTLARRTVVQWGEVANEAAKADNLTTTAQTHTTAEAGNVCAATRSSRSHDNAERRVDEAPNTVEDLAVVTAAATAPEATVATTESGGSLPGLCGVPTPPAAPADALATDKAAADDVTDITNENPVSSAVPGENAEMQGVSPAQLDSLQCTVGGIVQACRALALAAQQYELARALEDHDAPPRRPASRQRQEQQQQQQQKESYETHGLGSSSDLEGIAHPESTAKPEDGQDERLESQLPTSTQAPDMWPPAVLHDASAAAAGGDAVFGISPPILASPAVTTPSSPLLPAASQLFVDKTRHERQRILALCQRMFDLIAGRNNGADATDAAAMWTEEDEEKSPGREAMRVFPPSSNTAKENEEKRGRGGHHALKLGPLHTDSVEDTLRLGSLSHGMRGPPCPTPSDDSIGSAQPLPRSRRRVSSPASPGPSQLFAPLLAPLRRTSTAYTLTSVPAALLTMQSNTLFSAASTSSAAAAAEEEESGETSLESGALISVPHMPATSPLSREHRPSVEGMTNCLPRVLVAPLSLHRQQQQQQQQPSVVVVSAASTTTRAESMPRSSTEARSRNTNSAATARPNQESVAGREQEADDVSGDGATALETVVCGVTGHEEELDGRAVLLAVPPLPPPLPVVVRVDATQQTLTPPPPPSTAAAAVLQDAGTQTLVSPPPPTPSMPPKRSDAATSTSALPCGGQRSPRVASSTEQQQQQQQQQRQRSLSQCSVETAEVTPYKHRSNHHRHQQSRSHDRSCNSASRDGAGEDEQTEAGGDDDTSSTLSPASEHSSNRLTNAIASGRSSPMPSSVSLSSLAAATMHSQDGGPRPENNAAAAAANARCDGLDSDDEVMRGGASEEVLSPPAPEVARCISLATESVTPVHAEANDDRSAELVHQHHNDHEVFTSASVKEAQSPPAAAQQQQHATRSALLNAAASTPPRSSAAAVTALADLQQRLGGSNSTVAELRQQLEKATDEARVRDKAMTRLQRRLDVAEAALRRAESSQEAQLERLQLRPPPPLSTTTPVMRSSVGVNTSAEAKATRQPQQTQTQLLLSPSVPPTPMKVEVVPQRRESGVQVLLRASSPPLLRVEAATSPVPELAATLTTAAAASRPSRAEAVVNESGPTTPAEQTFIASQMPADMRIAELEADLRNAAFRMEQWKALLEAERHARAVQVDQLTHQLEREQRRVQRQQSSRSRSRSLSPPDVSAGPMRAGVVVEVPASNQHRGTLEALEPQPSAASTTALLTPPAEELSRREEALQRRVASVVDRLLAAETRLEEQKAQAAQEAAAAAAVHQRECVQLHERVAELEEMLAAERLRERQTEVSSAVDAAAAAAAATQAVREKDEALHRLEVAQQQLREELHEEQQQRAGERVQHERELTSLQRALAAAQHSAEALQDSLRDEEDAHQRTRFEHAAALSTVSAAQVANRVEVAQLQRGASVWWAATGNLLSTFAHTKTEIVREAAVQVHREAEEKSRNAVAALEAAQATLHDELAAARADGAKRDVDLRRELEEERRNAATTAATQAAAITLQRVQAAQTAQVAQRTREWWETTQACVSAWAESQNRCFVDAIECHTRESSEVHASVVAGLRHTIALQAAAATALHDELAAARADVEEGRAALQASEAAHKRTVADAERRDELQLLTQQSQQALRSAFHRASAAWWASRTSCLEDWSAAKSHLLTEACSSVLATATREQREALEGAVARAATAHAAVTDQLQQQLSTVQHAAAVASERLQREEEAHHRTVAALTATQAATAVVQRSEAAQHARLLHTHAAWWSAQDACGLEWVAAKVDLLHRAYAVQQQRAWQSALVVAVERLTDSVERQTMASTPQVQRIESHSPPQRTANHIVQRDDNGDEAYEAPEARRINHNASSRRSRSPDVMVMSLEDPLGLRYELQRKARRVRQLEAHVQQLEATHQADRQSLATLQTLRQQESVDTRSPPPSTAAAAAVPYGKQAWSPSSTPLRQQRTDIAASPPYRAPSQTWEGARQSNAPLSSTPSGEAGDGAGRRRWTPSEYQQRFAGI